jgi:hypothetical protein
MRHTGDFDLLPLRQLEDFGQLAFFLYPFGDFDGKDLPALCAQDFKNCVA